MYILTSDTLFYSTSNTLLHLPLFSITLGLDLYPCSLDEVIDIVCITSIKNCNCLTPNIVSGFT